MGCLVLECSPSPTSSIVYRILKLTQIKSLSVLDPPDSIEGDSFLSPPSSLSASLRTPKPVSIVAIASKEAAAVKAELDRRRRWGPENEDVDVGWEGREMFIALEKTLPVRWQGTSIIVMDEITISAPYRPEDCKSGTGAGAAQRMERVRKVVEGERARMSQAPPAVGTPAQKT